MRQIFLDTETTGLYPAQGHRIIEIAAIEMVNRRPTNRHFHVYLNPEREIDLGAQEVHGITLEFLQDKPLFAGVVDAFLAFVSGAELIIHNAPFDIGFINSELGKLGLPDIEPQVAGVIDTLKMAKESRPGQKNNLDALCRHFGVDNSKRTLHGALLDAELLAEVYMAMTRGQETLMMVLETPQAAAGSVVLQDTLAPIQVQYADAEELSAHQAYLAGLAKAGKCVWPQAEAENVQG